MQRIGLVAHQVLFVLVDDLSMLVGMLTDSVAGREDGRMVLDRERVVKVATAEYNETSCDPSISKLEHASLIQWARLTCG